MSEVERNKGRLVPINVDTEHFSDEEWEAYQESGFAVINGEVYEIQWEVKRDTDDYGFADVRENENGTIEFHTMHYNGGGSWTEVVEDALNEKA